MIEHIIIKQQEENMFSNLRAKILKFCFSINIANYYYYHIKKYKNMNNKIICYI